MTNPHPVLMQVLCPSTAHSASVILPGGLGLGIEKNDLFEDQKNTQVEENNLQSRYLPGVTFWVVGRLFGGKHSKHLQTTLLEHPFVTPNSRTYEWFLELFLSPLQIPLEVTSSREKVGPPSKESNLKKKLGQTASSSLQLRHPVLPRFSHVFFEPVDVFTRRLHGGLLSTPAKRHRLGCSPGS